MKSDFLTNLFFRALQTVSIATMLVRLLLPVAIVAALYLLWRIARNLEKPPKLTEEVKIVRKSLSETLKENRTRCKMTQEFVAETIGVSRQAVSKWENGTSEPNTSNLMALARLYGIPAEDLLKGVESALEAQEKESQLPLQLHHIRPEALGAMGHAAFFIVARFDLQRFVELRPQRLKLLLPRTGRRQFQGRCQLQQPGAVSLVQQYRFVKIWLKILCRGRKLAYSIFIRIVMSWPSCMVPSER